jgi:hypothetical protein
MIKGVGGAYRVEVELVEVMREVAFDKIVVQKLTGLFVY